jgi:hypothetical protein
MGNNDYKWLNRFEIGSRSKFTENVSRENRQYALLTIIITTVSFILGAEAIASSAVVAIQTFTAIATSILSRFASEISGGEKEEISQ